MSTLVFITEESQSVINAFCVTQGLDISEVSNSIKGILKTFHRKDESERVLKYSDIEFNFFMTAKFNVYNHSSMYMGNKSNVVILSNVENIYYFKS
jgi:hypothetical protein